MPNDPDIPSGPSRESPMAGFRARSAEANQAAPPAPASKPLQIFLAVALIITGTAYLAGEWTDPATHQNIDPRLNRLHQLVARQNAYLSETKLGRAAEEKKQFAQAITHYRRALEGKDKAEGHLNLGNALLKANQPDLAFEQFNAALRLDPNLTETYADWGHALVVQGRAAEAIALYQQALQRNPASGQLHFLLATTLESLHRNDEAAKHYAKAGELGLNTPEFWSDYGALLNNQGKFSEAVTCLNKSVEANPGSATAQLQLALAQDHLGDYAGAIGHYESALSLTPDDPPTLDHLALLYATATDPDVRSPQMAILLATRACAATTDQNARFMDTLARSYAANGDFFQAITWEDKAIHRAAQLVDRNLLGELNTRFAAFRQHKMR